MDYGPFVQQHRRRRADVTIAVKPVPLGEAHRFGILGLDDSDAVTEWQEKPRQPRSDLASLGIYVFSRRALDTWLGDGRDDFGGDVIPAMLEGGARVYGYRFDGYWQDVGTVHSYWAAQMELLDDHPPLDLYGPRLGHPHPFRGASAGAHRSDRQRAPQPHQPRLRHRRDGRATRSSRPACGSTRAPSCATASSCSTRSCRAGAVVDRAIVDKEVSVGPNAVVGTGSDFDTPNHDEPNA